MVNLNEDNDTITLMHPCLHVVNIPLQFQTYLFYAHENEKGSFEKHVS